MKKKHSHLFVLSAILIFAVNCFGKQSSLYIPINIRNAYQNNTRSYDGTPGPNYWQNRADYVIHIDFDPGSRLLKGLEKITYFNNSPDELSKLVFHLFPNIYKRGNARDLQIAPGDLTTGVSIDKISVNGNPIDNPMNSPAIRFSHTGFILILKKPLPSNGRTVVTISWHYTVNRETHIRSGAVGESSFFIAYFFPRIAVYDDIDGWNHFKYTGDVEFYNDFGSFDVSITVPRHYIVWATGILQNPQEVLTRKYLDRYVNAQASDTVVSIISAEDVNQKNITAANKKNTWEFRAEYVTDFAFALSDHYLWDGCSLTVDKQSGRRVFIDAAYNKRSEDFYRVASLSRDAVNYFSRELPGIPFPYPAITVFNGKSEMEYPMMVNDISVDNFHYTIKLTAHEISHNYFPFYMGFNETKYAWMDEGWASFLDFQFVSDYAGPEHAYFYFWHRYKTKIGHLMDMPIITQSEFLKRPPYRYLSYTKPACFLLILKDLLGEDVFKSALHLFMERWQGKHPMPYDFFFSFSQAAGQDLDWLIEPWFFRYGYVDLAVKDITITDDNAIISILKKGRYPAPVHLQVTFTDGSKKQIKKTAAVWKDGKTLYRVTVPVSSAVTQVELINRGIPDADLSNNKLIVN